MKPTAYSANERQRKLEMLRIVEASPELGAAVRQSWATGEAPRVRLRCPRGHLLLTVQVGADDRDGKLVPFLEPVGAPRRYPVAVNSTPSRVRTVCSETGCPASVDRSALECERGHRQVDGTQGLRTSLSCRRCSYACPHTQERLLKLYAVALHLRRDDLTL